MPWLTPEPASLRSVSALPRWGGQALAGRLCELSGAQSSVALTVAMGLVLDAQVQGETTAWVTTTHSHFMPPDAEAMGVDLDALVVIRVPEARWLGRAADHLARSGAFGVIVIDLASDGVNVTLPPALQSRLLGLAQKHQLALIFLSHKPAEAPSLSSLVSLRGHVQRRTLEQGRLAYELTALKDKRGAPGWSHVEDVDGPPGLR